MVATTSSWTCFIPAAWPAPVAHPGRAERHTPSPRVCGRRLPLQKAPPGLQRVYRHPLAGYIPQPRPDPLDPPGHRARGCLPRNSPVRWGSAASICCGRGTPSRPAPGRRGPLAAAGRSGRGRRDVPKRSRGALQHHGGNLDGAAKLLPAVPGRQQLIFIHVYNHYKMVVQPQGDHRRVPAVLARMFIGHRIRYMSQKGFRRRRSVLLRPAW